MGDEPIGGKPFRESEREASESSDSLSVHLKEIEAAKGDSDLILDSILKEDEDPAQVELRLRVEIRISLVLS